MTARIAGASSAFIAAALVAAGFVLLHFKGSAVPFLYLLPPAIVVAVFGLVVGGRVDGYTVSLEAPRRDWRNRRDP